MKTSTNPNEQLYLNLNVSKGAPNLESMGTVDFVTAFKMALDAMHSIIDPETGKSCTIRYSVTVL